MRSAHVRTPPSAPPEAEFFDEIQKKVLRVFLIDIHSHPYSFVLRLYFFKLMQPLTLSIVRYLHCKGDRRKT